VARFAPQSRWLAAARRLGKDLSLSEVRSQWDTNEWYSIAAGKGVMLLSALRAEVGAKEFDKALDDFGRGHAGQDVTSREFLSHLEQAAGHSLTSLAEPWLTGKGTLENTQQSFWSVDSFEVEPQRALIVYGTLEDREAQHEAADLLARKVARRFSNFSIPIISDADVSEDDLKNHHLLLIGRPSANSITARLADSLAVRFGPTSFVVRGETYAHADSAVVVAGENRLNDRYSVVVYAGMGARATRRCVESLPARGEPAEVLLMKVGAATKALHVSAPPLATAKP
jgi:hypothetical protein